MKRFYIFLVLGVIFLSRPVMGQSVEAFSPPVIAIMEYHYIERNSEAWKNFSEQFKTLKNSFQAETQSRQSELQQWQNDLQAQSTIMSPEDFAVEERKFRDAVRDLQVRTDSHKKSLDEVFNKALVQFRRNISVIAAEVARERNVDIVLNKSANDSVLLFWSPDLSISEEVLRRFNERFPEASISLDSSSVDADGSSGSQ